MTSKAGEAVWLNTAKEQAKMITKGKTNILVLFIIDGRGFLNMGYLRGTDI